MSELADISIGSKRYRRTGIIVHHIGNSNRDEPIYIIGPGGASEVVIVPPKGEIRFSNEARLDGPSCFELLALIPDEPQEPKSPFPKRMNGVGVGHDGVHLPELDVVGGRHDVKYPGHNEPGRLVIRCYNQGGEDTTLLDVIEVLRWLAAFCPEALNAANLKEKDR